MGLTALPMQTQLAKKFVEQSPQLARVIYMEQDWVSSVRRIHLSILWIRLGEKYYQMVDELLELCDRERVPLKEKTEIDTPENMLMNYDIIAWAADKFSRPLQDFRLDQPVNISLKINELIKNQIEAYNKVHLDKSDLDYFYEAVSAIMPGSRSLYELNYFDKPAATESMA